MPEHVPNTRDTSVLSNCQMLIPADNRYPYFPVSADALHSDGRAIAFTVLRFKRLL